MATRNIKDKLIKLVIKEIDKGNWNILTISYMSNALKVSPKKVLSICSSKHDLLDSWSQNVNEEMVKNISTEELKEVPIKERILELMLCRFDVLSKKRKEINILVQLSKSNLKESRNSLKRIHKSMGFICNYADVSTKGSQGVLKVKAITIIWLLAFKEWWKNGMRNEDKLMSQLDKKLLFAEKLKSIIYD
tara:strand:+ start:207 stop:779 length:573 start_codon:yes stop_codon:yes gene_type:complete